MPSTDHHQIHSTTEPDCYFSIVSTSSNHYSTETPFASPEPWLESPNLLSDPHNPLLALRPASALFNHYNHMDASRLMQHQTTAAHSSARSASKSSPWQDVLHVDYEGSHAYSRSNSSSSTSSNSSTSSTTLSTCSRCQTQGDTGFLRYAMNSYYCPRCAKIVGYGT